MKHPASSTIRDFETRLQRSDGAAELRVRTRDGVTAVAHLFQSDPCRVFFPTSEPGNPLQAVLITTSGGLTDGDRVRIEVGCDQGTQLTVTGQAAEKIYRAAGPHPCQIDIRLTAADGAELEWLPQETIVFDGARLRRRTEVALAPTARLLACEILMFGRSASGEQFTAGSIHDGWRIRRDGRLVWADALQVKSALPVAAGFGTATASGFALYSGAGAADLLAPSRASIEACDSTWPLLRSGTTLVNGIILARFLGEGKDVRAATMKWLTAMRQAAFGRPARMPRVWHI